MIRTIKEICIALSDYSLFVLGVGTLLLFKAAYFVYLDLDYRTNFILGLSLLSLSFFMTFVGFYLINKDNKSRKKISTVEFYSMLYTFTSFQRHGEWQVEKVKNGFEIYVRDGDKKKRLMFIDGEGKDSEALAKFISVCPDYIIRLFDSYLSECACEDCVEVKEIS